MKRLHIRKNDKINTEKLAIKKKMKICETQDTMGDKQHWESMAKSEGVF